jgi:hypothetical protein
VLDNVLSVLKSEHKPSAGAFLQLEPRTLADKLGLQKRGKANGLAGIPHHETDLFDEVEYDVIGAIRSAATDAQGRTNDQIATYGQRLKSADISGAATEMMVLSRQAEGDFEAEILTARIALRRAKIDALEHELALTDFKARHRLRRPPNPMKDRTILGSILVIMFAVEVLPNAVILGSAEELGFLGGITQATIYSFLNIGFGFLAGRLAWTNIFHRNWVRKLLGFAVSLALAGFIVGLNMALAHYRTFAQTMDSTQAVIAAWNRLFSVNAASISDIKSAGMVAMGVLFSFIAMIDGWLWDDPYPGYAAVSRHHRDAEVMLHREALAKIAFLKEVQEGTVEKIKIARSRLRDRRQEIPLVLEERRRLLARYDSHIAHLQDVGRHLLSIYRTANRAARPESDPTPKHFDQLWALDGFERVAVDDEVWAIPEDKYREADRALEASVEKLQASFEAALRWIKKLNGANTRDKIDAVVGE